jgi:Icc-related predicted phosphoesterase
MKIGIVSDLHLEFADLDLPNHDGIDVLILGGDICVAEDLYRYPADSEPAPGDIVSPRREAAGRYREFLQRCSERFPHVIYVMGNHEHYHGQWERTQEVLERELEPYSNMHLLEMSQIVIDGVEFIGATLWTDCNRRDPLTEFHLNQRMNDYTAIRRAEANYQRLRPYNTIRRHDRSLSYIQQALSNPQGRASVVCTHHAPSKASTHPRYAHDHLMNGGYSSDLDDIIQKYPHLCLWTHGHTHDAFDYTIGATRIVCNPRGYVGHERDASDIYLAQVIDI